MQQTEDFRTECRDLEAFLRKLDPSTFNRSTLFKDWTINEIMRHLHVWNVAADLAAQDETKFKIWIKRALKPVLSGTLRDFEKDELSGLSGAELLDLWAEFYPGMCDRFSQFDPSHRVAWAGPSMSVRSSITARLMETWAHAQAIYDLEGVRRVNHDRIKNIVILGVNTYGWTFKNRGEDVPTPMPYIELKAPSGAIWKFGDEHVSERIEGLAEDFAQVVTQTRNIADVNLTVIGSNAQDWMSKAQCFAGPPNDPPISGSRMVKSGN